jgi:fructoselysine 6-kinase
MSTKYAGPCGVATVGDNCIDVYVPPVSAAAVGGNAVNVAVNFRLKGVESYYLGAVGSDDQGLRVRQALSNVGVGSERVRVIEGRTGVSRILLAPDGDWTLLDEDQGVCDTYRPTADDLEFLAARRHVHCAHLPAFWDVARDLASKGVPVSYDFSTDQETKRLEGLDIAFFSVPDGATRAEHLLANAVRAGARIAVATCGKRGSVAFDGAVMTRADAVLTKAVDTVGAGDSYIAAFIYGRLSGESIEGCMQAGAQAAADTCQHLGAWPQALVSTPVAT